MTRLLEVRDLHKYFGSHEAVRGFDFDIDDGDWRAVRAQGF